MIEEGLRVNQVFNDVDLNHTSLKPKTRIEYLLETMPSSFNFLIEELKNNESYELEFNSCQGIYLSFKQYQENKFEVFKFWTSLLKANIAYDEIELIFLSSKF